MVVAGRSTSDDLGAKMGQNTSCRQVLKCHATRECHQRSWRYEDYNVLARGVPG